MLARPPNGHGQRGPHEGRATRRVPHRPDGERRPSPPSHGPAMPRLLLRRRQPMRLSRPTTTASRAAPTPAANNPGQARLRPQPIEREVRRARAQLAHQPLVWQEDRYRPSLPIRGCAALPVTQRCAGVRARCRTSRINCLMARARLIRKCRYRPSDDGRHSAAEVPFLIVLQRPRQRCVTGVLHRS